MGFYLANVSEILPGHPTKTCTRCGEVKPVSVFAPRLRRPGTRWPWCRPCRAEDVRNRRAAGLDHDDQHARYLREARQRKARNTVARALRKGRLVRPERCQDCGDGGVIDAHHHSYEREHWLDVVWVCRICHNRRDAERRRREQEQQAALPRAA